MAQKLKAGKTWTVKKLPYTEIYAITGRNNVDYNTGTADLYLDMYPNAAIKNMKNIRNRIDEISIHLEGDDFDLYFSEPAMSPEGTTLKSQAYKALSEAVKPKLDESDPDVFVIDKSIFESDE